ncbi:MAG: tryptophan 7-halogenase [Asticcacaulis sp.]
MQQEILNPSAACVKHILICGTGLAAQMAVAAIARQVPAYMQITWLRAEGTQAHDVLYGGIATPAAYDFNLMAGVDEPTLILESNTAFAYGTHYRGWNGGRPDWVQAFQAPFPVWEGVLFYHYLLQRGLTDIGPWLVAAQAARHGVFAHPPEDQRHPLSAAEYGYQFEPAAYGALFERGLPKGITTLTGDIVRVERDGEAISSVELKDGRSLKADLYVDCTGPDARLAGPSGRNLTGGQGLRFMASRAPERPLGPPHRTVSAGRFGWTARTHVEGAALHLTIHAAADEDAALAAHGVAPAFAGAFATGWRAAAWSGNCVALGQAAGVAEPLTPAPFLLLQRDVERLVTLLPASLDMKVEQREFNRQFTEDYRNAFLFNQSLFVGEDRPAGTYWEAARAAPRDERLTQKIEQFESRGLHVAYDLEPFGQEDWIIQHFGMGRRAERYDRVADHTPRAAMDRHLDEMRQAIAAAVRTMPPHGAYRQNFANFLQQQSGALS